MKGSSWSSGTKLAGVELTRHTAVDDRQRGRADIFAEQEILIKPDAETLVVIGCRAMFELGVPAIDEQFALFNRTDGFLPLIAQFEPAALDDAATGKAEEAGLHVGERLHHVGAQTALAVLPGVARKERNEIDVDLAASGKHQTQARTCFGVSRRKRDFALRPCGARAAGHFGGSEHEAGRRDEFRTHEQSRAAAHIDAEIVNLALLHADAAKALVLDHGASIRGNDAREVRVGRMTLRIALHSHPRAARVGRGHVPAGERFGKLKRPILHQLGVETAVGAEVDVLVKHTPHRGLDRGAGPVDIDTNLDGGRCDGEKRARGNQCEQPGGETEGLHGKGLAVRSSRCPPRVARGRGRRRGLLLFSQVAPGVRSAENTRGSPLRRSPLLRE
ncbi:MAG: hypothetical protein NVV63_14780 [Opitutus sp.]|nr:hypothetical protein [Opitutus sp.]